MGVLLLLTGDAFSETNGLAIVDMGGQPVVDLAFAFVVSV